MNGVILTKKCKRCKRKFETEWPRQAYCSDACKYGLAACRKCGKEFIKKPRTTGKFCSIDCWYAYYEVHGKKEKLCPACGSVFHGPMMTCSKQCGYAWRKMKNPNRRTHCIGCGNQMPTNAKPGRKYCSHSCALKGNKHGSQVKPEGSKRQHAAGYIQVKHNGVWQMQHRLAMEKKLKRQLERHERVHHKNGKRADNRPTNLELWKVKKKDPAGVRAEDYHCPGCRCFDKE